MDCCTLVSTLTLAMRESSGRSSRKFGAARAEFGKAEEEIQRNARRGKPLARLPSPAPRRQRPGVDEHEQQVERDVHHRESSETAETQTNCPTLQRRREEVIQKVKKMPAKITRR